MSGLCSGMSGASEFQAQLKTCSLCSWQLINAGCQLGASLRLWLEALHVLPVNTWRKERKPYCLVRPGLRNTHCYVHLPPLRQKVLPQFGRRLECLSLKEKWRCVYVIYNGAVIWADTRTVSPMRAKGTAQRNLALDFSSSLNPAMSLCFFRVWFPHLYSESPKIP